MGKGLFAGQAFSNPPLKRDKPIVIEFQDGARMTARAWETYHAKLGIPHDAGMHFYNYVIYDKAFTNLRNPPAWYRLNHSGKPNLEMIKKGNTIMWRVKRIIKRGDQLTFDYKEPDPSWL